MDGFRQSGVQSASINFILGITEDQGLFNTKSDKAVFAGFIWDYGLSVADAGPAGNLITAATGKAYVPGIFSFSPQTFGVALSGGTFLGNFGGSANSRLGNLAPTGLGLGASYGAGSIGFSPANLSGFSVGFGNNTSPKSFLPKVTTNFRVATGYSVVPLVQPSSNVYGSGILENFIDNGVGIDSIINLVNRLF